MPELETAFAPGQAGSPFVAVQETALVVDHDKIEAALYAIVTGFAEKLRVGFGTTVTVIVCDAGVPARL
jgi:hypothetical protein